MFGAPTPKRSALWSNSRFVAIFNRGRLTKANKPKKTIDTAVAYQDSHGRKRYKGCKNALKQTQFGSHLVKALNTYIYNIQYMFQLELYFCH